MPQYRLENPIQAYPWGHPTRLAELQGREPTALPGAELWLGAHPSGPSQVLDGGAAVPLGEFLKMADFPFLLKILAIGKPLSIQVHPNPEQARIGYDRDQRAGLELSDPRRSYKDPYAKPEVVVALEPMKLLIGVKSASELRALTDLGLTWLEPFLGLGVKELIGGIFNLTDEVAMAAHDQTVALCRRGGGQLEDLVDQIESNYPGDRGLLVAVCMNLIELQPGQTAFTPDGVLHAYLSGLAVEIMNPSDNVLRAGLTTKHIDVAELVRILKDEQSAPEVAEGIPLPDGGDRIQLWNEELQLRRYAIDGQTSIELGGTDILLVTDGTLEISCADQSDVVGAGHALLITDADRVGVEGTGQFFVASC